MNISTPTQVVKLLSIGIGQFGVEPRKAKETLESFGVTIDDSLVREAISLSGNGNYTGQAQSNRKWATQADDETLEMSEFWEERTRQYTPKTNEDLGRELTEKKNYHSSGADNLDAYLPMEYIKAKWSGDEDKAAMFAQQIHAEGLEIPEVPPVGTHLDPLQFLKDLQR